METLSTSLGPPSATLELAPGSHLGRFAILRLLGRGGMGAVYEARDPELGRSVAVKVLGAARRGGELRLLREAQALARLAHPNVVSVHEVGLADDRVFIAMEYVDGQTLAEELATRVHSWPDVVRLFVAAGRGLAAAHARGLVHRDFKPGNVLIDRSGRVRVTDFGLARLEVSGEAPTAAGAPDANVTSDDSVPPLEPLDSPITVAGALMGTPRYMAPEQRAGGPVTAHGDQYSFCVALWEAVFGELPPARRRDAPRWLRRALETGLAARPAQRHASMAVLLDVLERTPIARRRLAWRAGIAALVLFVAAAVLIVTLTLSLRRVAEERDRATTMRARSEAERMKSELTTHELMLLQARASLSTDPTATLAWLKAYLQGGTEWLKVRDLAAAAAARGYAVRVDRDHDLLVSSALAPDGHTLATGGGDGKIVVTDLATGTRRVLLGHTKMVASLVFSPDGSRLISAAFDGSARWWDLATGDGHELGRGRFLITTAAIAPTGRRIAWSQSRHIAVWTDGQPELVTLGEHPQEITKVAFAPEGDLLLSVGGDLRVWDLVAGTSRVLFAPKAPLMDLALMPDGRRVAVGGYDDAVTLVDIATGSATIIARADANIEDLSVSPDGRHVASVSNNGRLLVASPSGQVELDLKSRVRRPPVFAPASDAIISGDTSGTTLVTTLASGRERRLLGQRSPWRNAFYTGEGKLVTVSDANVFVWALPGPPVRELGGGRAGGDFDLARDGSLVAWGADDGSVWVAGLPAGVPRKLGSHQGAVPIVLISPDATQVATAGVDNRIQVVRLASGTTRTLELVDPLTTIAFSPDGTKLAYAFERRFAVGLWSLDGDGDGDGDGNGDGDGDHARTEVRTRPSFVWNVLFSPDGRWLAAEGSFATRPLWNLETGADRVLDVGGQRGRALFSPDSRFLYWSTDTGDVGRWNLVTDKNEHLASVATAALVLGSTGRTLALQRAGDVELLDLASGEAQRFGGAPVKFAFADNDRLGVGLERDGSLRVKELATGALTLIDEDESEMVVMPRIDAILTRSKSGFLQVWRPRSGVPAEPESLRRWIDESTTVTLDADRRPTTP